MVLHTTYVIRVPYNCGVVLVFLVVAENVFGVTYTLSVQYSCVAGKLILYKFCLLNPNFLLIHEVSQKILRFSTSL